MTARNRWPAPLIRKVILSRIFYSVLLKVSTDADIGKKKL